MQTFASANDVLDFAIGKEQEAHDFYVVLAGQAANPAMAQAFREFAGEELGHKAKLQAVKSGEQLLAARSQVLDLKISDYLVDVEPGTLMTYQQALIVAMKLEKAAFRLYTDLAALVPAGLRELFLSLAQEEAKHKLRFELEYDEQILKEN